MTENSNITTTDYNGSYVYQNNALQFVFTPEGYATPNGSGGYDYVYQYKDLPIAIGMGNIRLSYSDANYDGLISATSEIVEENNYYPFGLQHKGYNGNITGRHHKYMFGGKELQDEIVGSSSFEVYDFGARNYDPALGRFTSVDPLADASPQESLTPYQYAYNNPVQYNDPYGDCPWCVGAIVGALVDVAVQGAEIYFDDSKSLDDFSWKSVGVSAVAGATGVGLISKIGKVGKLGNVLKAGAEVVVDGSASAATQYYQNGEIKAANIIYDVAGGQIANSTVGKVMDVKFTNSKKGKHLQTKINEQKNVAKGKSSKYAKSEADINGAQNKYKANQASSGAAATTSASTATSKITEEGIKYLENEIENN